MSELTDKLRLSALEVSSRLEASGEQGIADLLSEAADQIEILNDSEMRWIGRIYDIRAALGCFEKPMLSELGEEVKRRLAEEYARGKEDAAQIVEAVNSTWRPFIADQIRKSLKPGGRP